MSVVAGAGLVGFAGFFVVEGAGTGMSVVVPGAGLVVFGAGVDFPGFVEGSTTAVAAGVAVGLRPFFGAGVGVGVGAVSGAGVAVGFFLREPKSRWKKLGFFGFGVGWADISAGAMFSVPAAGLGVGVGLGAGFAAGLFTAAEVSVAGAGSAAFSCGAASWAKASAVHAQRTVAVRSGEVFGMRRGGLRAGTCGAKGNLSSASLGALRS